MTLRHKIPVLAISLVSGICALLFSLWFLSLYVFGGGPGASLGRIGFSESRIPVTLTVYGRSSDTISAKLAFYAASGELTGTLERSWFGWELKIDCIIARAGNGWLVFPFMLYTDETRIGKGVSLIRFYNRSSLPALYDSALLDKKERSALKRLFGLVLTESWMPSFLGSLHHETVTIRSFEPGTEYSLYVTKDGSVRLRSN